MLVKSKVFVECKHYCLVCSTVIPLHIDNSKVKSTSLLSFIYLHLSPIRWPPLLINKSKVKSKEVFWIWTQLSGLFYGPPYWHQGSTVQLPAHNWLVVFACPLLINMSKWNQGHGEKLDSIVRSISLPFILTCILQPTIIVISHANCILIAFNNFIKQLL